MTTGQICTKLLRREEKRLLEIQKNVKHKLDGLRSAIAALGQESHGKRRVSAAARRKMSLAAKKRWAKAKSKSK